MAADVVNTPAPRRWDPSAAVSRCVIYARRKVEAMTSRLMLAVTTMLILQLGVVSSVFAQGTLFDDFSAPAIRGDRWRTDQFEGGLGSGLETLRLISNGALLLVHRVVGGTTSDFSSTTSAARMF